MSEVHQAFQIFSTQVLQGDSGIFFSDRRINEHSKFYMGTGDYDLVSFADDIYPKYSVFDWKGEQSYHYAFEHNYTNGELDLTPSQEIDLSSDLDEILKWVMPNKVATQWQEKIEKVIAAQKNGEAWVLNLAHDFVSGMYEETTNIKEICCQLFWRFLQIDKGHCACLVFTNEQIFCSFSPELFIRQEKDVLITSPIKGTGTIEYLRNSKKEESELDMVTDLLRNDLGQVCNLVEVIERRFLRAEKNFYSARSLIQATLATTFTQAYPQLLPAGSISGAPKQRVVEIIESLENFDRGFYTGTMGVQLSPDDSVWNILIRTLFIDPAERTWSFPVGVGVTAESDPLAEWQETLEKVSLLTDLQS